MKFIEKIENSDRVLFTLEIVPPEKGYSLRELFDTIESVKEFSPAIINKFGIDPIPHIICGGFTKEEIEDILIDLHFLGINNLLLLQGDKLADEPHFIPTKGGD